MDNSYIIVMIAGFAACLFFVWRHFASTQKKLSKRFFHDMQNLRYELYTKTNHIEFVAYERLNGSEKIVYDNRGKNIDDNWTGQGARDWDYTAHCFSGNTGTGSHKSDEHAMVINRTNTAGRYELYLNCYRFENITEEIPADYAIKQRLLRVSCEVKKHSASHVLRFVFKGASSKNALDEKHYVVFSPEWEKVNLVFVVASNEASILRIDNLSVLEAPSSIYIRNIVLYEKKLD